MTAETILADRIIHMSTRTPQNSFQLFCILSARQLQAGDPQTCKPFVIPNSRPSNSTSYDIIQRNMYIDQYPKSCFERWFLPITQTNTVQVLSYLYTFSPFLFVTLSSAKILFQTINSYLIVLSNFNFRYILTSFTRSWIKCQTSNNTLFVQSTFQFSQRVEDLIVPICPYKSNFSVLITISFSLS